MVMIFFLLFFFFSSRRRHTRYWRDWSSDVCSSDLVGRERAPQHGQAALSVDGFGEAVDDRAVGSGWVEGSQVLGHRASGDGEAVRSEERRVGEECRSRWSPDHLKKKNE